MNEESMSQFGLNNFITFSAQNVFPDALGPKPIINLPFIDCPSN